EYKFVATHAAYIRLFPISNQSAVGLAKITALFETRKMPPMSTTIGGLVARNRFGPIILDPEGQTTISGLTQGFPTGELWGVSGKIFVPHVLDHYFKSLQKRILVIPIISFEQLFVKALRDYVHVSTSELDLQVPCTVELGLTGLDG